MFCIKNNFFNQFLNSLHYACPFTRFFFIHMFLIFKVFLSSFLPFTSLMTFIFTIPLVLFFLNIFKFILIFFIFQEIFYVTVYFILHYNFSDIDYPYFFVVYSHYSILHISSIIIIFASLLLLLFLNNSLFFFIST